MDLLSLPEHVVSGKSQREREKVFSMYSSFLTNPDLFPPTYQDNV